MFSNTLPLSLSRLPKGLATKQLAQLSISSELDAYTIEALDRDCQLIGSVQLIQQQGLTWLAGLWATDPQTCAQLCLRARSIAKSIGATKVYMTIDRQSGVWSIQNSKHFQLEYQVWSTTI